MDASERGTDPQGREVNPLLFIFFCPYRVLSGVFAMGATGAVSLPHLFGLAPEAWLAPSLILGTFLAWLAWGAWSRRCQAETCRPTDGAAGSAEG